MVEPTGYTALDLIGFTDRGDYDPSAYYVKNDLVHDGVDNIWRVLIDDTHGVTPAEGLNYTIFIRNHGTEAEEIIAPVESNPAAAAHAVGTQLIYNGALYDVTTAIAAGAALVVYPTSGYNIKAAGTVASQIQTLTNGEQATRDSIAPTENGTNYSTSYSKGAQFYHNGVLREVTASSVNTSSVISSTSATVDSITKQIGTIDTDLAQKVNHFFYNSNTDSSVQANVTNAMKYIMDNYGSSIGQIRYLGGLYNLYVISYYNDGISNVLEITYAGKINFWLFDPANNTWSKTPIVS